jgi:uncharacterized protein (TIRG00374 family)
LKKLVAFALLFLLLSAAVPFAIQRELGGQWPPLDGRLLSPVALISCLALLLVYFSADGLRLYYLLRAQGQRLPARQMARLVFINILFSNLTPMATGGGFAQIGYLRTQGVHLGAATAATTLRTLLASLMIFLPTPFLLGCMRSLQENPMLAGWSGYLAVFAGLYAGFFLLTLTRPRWLMAIGTAVLRGLRAGGVIGEERLRHWRFALYRELLRFAAALGASFEGPRRDLALSLLFTLLFLLSLFSFPALLFWLLGYSVDYLSVVGLMVVTTFAMYFAPTPGAAGMAEGVFALLFAGVAPAADLLLVLIAWRVLTIYLGMLIGVPVTLRLLLKRGQKA